MGIKNLLKLIREYAPGAITTTTLEELRDARVAIDASIAVYQWVSAGVSSDIKNSRGDSINHIQGAFYRTAKLVAAGVVPVYVFDGPPPERKERVLEQRRARRTAYPGREVFSQVAALLETIGVPVLRAPGEAEAECAYLSSLGVVDYVATPDLDAIVFGARKVVLDLGATKKTYTVVDGTLVLQELGLSRSQFTDLCILLGCDYTSTLPGIGYKRALAAIREYGSIDALVATMGAVSLDQFDYRGARDEFNAPLVYSVPRDQLVLRVLSADDMRQLYSLLVGTYGLLEGRIIGTLRKLAKFYGLIYKS